MWFYSPDSNSPLRIPIHTGASGFSLASSSMQQRPPARHCVGGNWSIFSSKANHSINWPRRKPRWKRRRNAQMCSKCACLRWHCEDEWNCLYASLQPLTLRPDAVGGRRRQKGPARYLSPVWNTHGTAKAVNPCVVHRWRYEEDRLAHLR